MRTAEQREVREQPAAGSHRGAVTVAVLLVIASVAGLWFLSSVLPPDRFVPHQYGNASMSMSAKPGETLHVTIARGSDHEVSLDEATLVVDDSSARATFDLLACLRRDRAPGLGSGTDVTLSDWCRSVEDPTEVPFGGPTDGTETYLLAVIQPMEPGRIFVDGVSVTHSWGPFDRTERTGGGLEVLVD